jgi:hypothetical protein
MTREKASVVVETLFVVPALMLVLLLISYTGRITQTSINLRGVAAVSARRASQASVASMSRVAELTAREEISARRIPCRRTALDVIVQHPVSSVRVMIRCEVSGNGLAALGVRPHMVSAASTAIVDRYRRQ